MKIDLQVMELRKTLKWIVKRIEAESDKQSEGKKPNWAKAAKQVAHEAHYVLTATEEVDDDKAQQEIARRDQESADRG